jgi:nucleotide-binding universal stress UspA family protein
VRDLSDAPAGRTWNGVTVPTLSPVLLCYDGSTGARRAIAAAAALLGPCHAIVLDVSPLLTVDETVAVVASGVPGDVFAQENEADALRHAELGAERARRAGFVAVEARVTFGARIWEEIVRVADEIDAAVIVLGSRGLHGLPELAAGSVSHDVVRHARRPVLIVPGPGAPTGRRARRTAPRRPAHD